MFYYSKYVILLFLISIYSCSFPISFCFFPKKAKKSKDGQLYTVKQVFAFQNKQRVTTGTHNLMLNNKRKVVGIINEKTKPDQTEYEIYNLAEGNNLSHVLTARVIISTKKDIGFQVEELQTAQSSELLKPALNHIFAKNVCLFACIAAVERKKK
ncbi:MAG: hypothetical protein WA432_01585 [Candidatus Babeliaceae bacterium]